MKIQETTQYDQFASNPHQRTFQAGKVNRLVQKMKRNGFPASMAISVFRGKGGKLVVNAGHHRLAAARTLSIPVKYVIEHEWSTRELADEGSESSAWAIKDHVANYAKEGNEDYMELLRLNVLGLHLSLAASMLHGEAAGSGNTRDDIKAGTFKIKSRAQVDKWLELHEEFGMRVPCIYHRTFICAFSKCLFTAEFDYDTFVKRLRNNPLMLDRCNSEDQQLKQIEELYNFKTPRKIPLAFIVTNNSRERKILNNTPKA